MTELSDYDLFPEPDDRAPAKCRHPRYRRTIDVAGTPLCGSCGHVFDPARSRRGKNSRTRGNKEELTVARRIGGRKVGPLGHPWDVEIEGYARLQVKKLATWPSLSKVIEWMEAIPISAEMRGVVLVGVGKPARRLIVLDLDEFAEHHGDPTKAAS